MVELPKPLSARQLFKLLKAEKSPKSALALFDSASRQPGYTHSPHIFLLILRRLSDPKLVVHVTRIVELIKTQKCKCTEDVVLTVLKAYAKSKMPNEALDCFQKMEEIFGCKPGIRSYNALLNAFIEANLLEKAESFLAYFETVGILPNLQTYNILIKISVKKRQFVEAKGLLDWMWSKDLKPDVYSYGTVINGMVKSGDLVSALEVFDEMFERGLVPDVICCRIMNND
jgi:pentatricopeptide repeat protein